MSDTRISNFAAALPWTCKRGRPDLLRGVVFVLLILPGLVLAVRWGLGNLGTRPMKVAIHSTGYWALWWLLASLLVTPLKALSAMPNIVVVRRMVGVTALCYALIHVMLYGLDEGGGLLHLGYELVSRFYLTLGAIAVTGLLVLGVTSTNGTMRRMGKRWKALHRIVYGLAVLAAVHYVLQSKADVSQALVATGVLAWLMLWRALPAGRDRTWLPVLILSVVAAMATLIAEFVWYRFGTKIDPIKAFWLEFDVSYGLHPAALVLAFGLFATLAVILVQIGKGRLGQTLGFTVALYMAGVFIGDVGAFLFGLFPDDSSSGLPHTLIAPVVLALLGLARFKLRDNPQRRWFDALLITFICYSLLMLDTDNQTLEVASATLVMTVVVIAYPQVCRVNHRASLLLIPFSFWIACESAIRVFSKT